MALLAPWREVISGCRLIAREISESGYSWGHTGEENRRNSGSEIWRSSIKRL